MPQPLLTSPTNRNFKTFYTGFLQVYWKQYFPKSPSYHRTFLQHIVIAGCCHYEVFITGKKVIYFGRDGSQYVELFPAKKS